ncbi:down syndrome cell adhesion molecule-like protein Dscam2, partial [Trichonephila inaurata madagascariensis]
NTLLAGGQRLADHRNGTLTIAQASKSDQGWYHCEVVGGQGEKAMGSLYIRVVGSVVLEEENFRNNGSYYVVVTNISSV